MLLLIFVGKVFNRFETEGGHTGPPSVSNPSIRMGRNGINIQMEVINSKRFILMMNAIVSNRADTLFMPRYLDIKLPTPFEISF